MPLKRDSDPVDHAALLRSVGLNPAGGYVPDVGYTSPAHGVAAPAYRVDVTPGDGQFTARLVVDQRAAEGDNTSIYLKAEPC